ncbi:unnamed protein product [Brassica oleracea var. botrytis]
MRRLLLLWYIIFWKFEFFFFFCIYMLLCSSVEQLTCYYGQETTKGSFAVESNLISVQGLDEIPAKTVETVPIQQLIFRVFNGFKLVLEQLNGRF